jgi:hypothetical protein
MGFHIPGTVFNIPLNIKYLGFDIFTCQRPFRPKSLRELWHRWRAAAACWMFNVECVYWRGLFCLHSALWTLGLWKRGHLTHKAVEKSPALVYSARSGNTGTHNTAPGVSHLSHVSHVYRYGPASALGRRGTITSLGGLQAWT